MKTIHFLKYGSEPDEIETDYWKLQYEKTGTMADFDEWECVVYPKGNANIYNVLDTMKDWYGIDVFSIMENGEVLETDETIRQCHLCDSTCEDKYCTNETCAEYTSEALDNVNEDYDMLARENANMAKALERLNYTPEQISDICNGAI